jgi:hypothetical protein
LLWPSIVLSSPLKLKFFENIWRGGAVLWVDVGSKSAKIGLVYWIRGEEDNRVVSGKTPWT